MPEVPVDYRPFDAGGRFVGLRNRFANVRDRWLSLVGMAKAPKNYHDVLQVQVKLDSAAPLAPEARAQAEAFFKQASELIHRKCLAGLSGPN